VRADGRDHDGGHGRVDHAGARRHRVRRAARRRRHDQTCARHARCQPTHSIPHTAPFFEGRPIRNKYVKTEVGALRRVIAEVGQSLDGRPKINYLELPFLRKAR
jgi:hypothetical protein